LHFIPLLHISLFVWLVADGWCRFVLREKYWWLVAGGWLLVAGLFREKSTGVWWSISQANKAPFAWR
jgi:hypothetical protein